MCLARDGFGLQNVESKPGSQWLPVQHVIRVGEAYPNCQDLHGSLFFWFTTFWILYLLERNGLLLKYVQAPFLIWRRHSAVCERWCTHTLLHPVFGCLKASLILSWFVFDFLHWYQSSDTVCFGGAYVWLHSWCTLLLSMRLSFVSVTLIEKVILRLNLPFLGFWDFE